MSGRGSMGAVMFYFLIRYWLHECVHFVEIQ